MVLHSSLKCTRRRVVHGSAVSSPVAVPCADLRGQNADAARLGKVLADGPLGDVAKGVTTLLGPITQCFDVSEGGLSEPRQLLVLQTLDA